MAYIALRWEMRRVVSTNVDLIAVFRHDLEELDNVTDIPEKLIEQNSLLIRNSNDDF
jgi:hypothetical protein